MSAKLAKRLVNTLSLLGIIIATVFVIYGLKMGYFKDTEGIKDIVARTGIYGPLVFVAIQIFQVVIPIIPGGITCAAGVLIFGPLYGFIYNYAGIVIGSVINFVLARRYGIPLIKLLVSDKIFEKYTKWMSNQKYFDKMFALAIFLPIAPDDALCLLAGITKMTFKQFFLIIILGKPLSIFLYSLALIYGGTFLTNFL